MIYLEIIIILLLLVQWSISLINLLSPLFLKKGTEQYTSLVSILIPLRNEESNCKDLIESILKQDYKHFELLLYNDQSTDKTLEIITDFAKNDSRIKIINGKELPKGWLGKPHACYELSQHAKGSYFLYIDADVRIYKQCIENTIRYLEKHQLSLVSIFPSQNLQSIGEKLTVPLMNWILLSLLPLLTISKIKNPLLAAANGQYMFFNANIYKSNNWHEKVKNKITEDISILKLIKEQQLKASTLLGNKEVVCRMYKNYTEAIKGFSKNTIDFFGGSIILFLLYLFISIYPFYMFLSYTNSLFYSLFILFIILSTRIFISIKSKQNSILNCILHPFQLITLIIIAIFAIKNKIKKRYHWKDREIKNNEV